MATNFLSLRSSAAASLTAVNLTLSTLTGSTITGSTITALSNASTKDITYSTLQGSSITTSSINVSTVSFSTLQGSSIRTSTMTGSTLVISSLLQISSSGLVGIGTNPTQALHVQGSTIVSGAIGIGSTAPTDILNLGSGNVVLNNNAAQASGFLYNQNSIWGGVEVEGLPGTGAQTINLGMNTNRSKAWSSTYNGLWLRVDNRTGTTYNGFHFFNKAATTGTESELMTILSSGSVGIGSSNPAASLDVNGSIISRGQTPAIAFLGDIDGAKWTAKLGGYNLSFGSDSGSFTGFESGALYGRTYQYGVQMTSTGGMNTKGSVGIGTTNPAQTLDVYGTIARNSLKLPRVDYGTLGAATTISIPILFSDTQYNMVEIRFRYNVNVVTNINMTATSTTPAAMIMEECGLTISKYNSPASPEYYNVPYNSGATSMIFASNVEVNFDNNLMLRIVRGSGGNRNHYCFDNIYCWSAIGTARGYGQGHINNTSTGGPAIAYINFTCTAVSATISGVWNTTHYN